MLKFENNGLTLKTSYISDILTNKIITNINWDNLKDDITNEYLIEVLSDVYNKSKKHVIEVSEKYYIISNEQLKYFLTTCSSMTTNKFEKLTLVDISYKDRNLPDILSMDQNKPIYLYPKLYKNMINTIYKNIKNKTLTDKKFQLYINEIFLQPDIYNYYEIWRYFCNKNDFIKNCEQYDLQQIINNSK